MIKLGIIRNPRSRRNRMRLIGDAGNFGTDVILREPRSHQELEAAIGEFAAEKVDVLAIDGGDGTIRDVLTTAIGTFERLPPVALLASGTTNILAADVGSWGTGEKALMDLSATLRAGLASRRVHRRPTLQLSFAGRRLHGFVFGVGAYSRTVAHANQGLADGLTRGWRIASAIARSAIVASRAGSRQVWLAGTRMELALDDEIEIPDEAAQARFLFLVTTLKRFVFGIWPFWGHEARPLRYLDVDAEPRRFLSALIPAIRGRPRPWMEEAGYRSGSATLIRLRLGEDFILDGEPFSPGLDGAVLLEAGPAVEFIGR